VTPIAAHALAKTFPIVGEHRVPMGCLKRTIRAAEWRGQDSAFEHLRECAACAAFYRVHRLSILLDDEVATLPRWRLRG